MTLRKHCEGAEEMFFDNNYQLNSYDQKILLGLRILTFSFSIVGGFLLGNSNILGAITFLGIAFCGLLLLQVIRIRYKKEA
jgi:hypothetical protein